MIKVKHKRTAYLLEYIITEWEAVIFDNDTFAILQYKFKV